MKILFLGEISPGQTSLMRMRALKRLGHEVVGVNTNEPWVRVSWLHRQLLKRLFGHGHVIDEINFQVLQTANNFKPDIVWADKQEYLRSETLDAIRKLGARLVHFTPDPYFTLDWKRTSLMDTAIRNFDFLVFCKAYERLQYEKLGRPVLYMPLGFCDEVHRPFSSKDLCWSSEVGFLGGWEPRRQELLRAVAESGANLKVWGGSWEFLIDGRWTPRRHIVLKQLAGTENFYFQRDPLIAKAYQGGEIYADNYARALSGAKIGLGFLRQVWPDQHTTRTFEIPACGSMLLADRTDEHCSLFEEGKEAEFFSSVDELLDKLSFYRNHDDARLRIANSGTRRCHDSRYAYIYRMSDVIDTIEKF